MPARLIALRRRAPARIRREYVEDRRKLPQHRGQQARELFTRLSSLHGSTAFWDWVDCVGRFDQYMYPFYEKAKEEDETAADELIASMMMKFFEHGIHTTYHDRAVFCPRTARTQATIFPTSLSTFSATSTILDPRMTLRISDKTPDTLIALAG